MSLITCPTGGDVNIKDDDDETPLFVVESIEVARWLVEHGASIDCRNHEGNTVRLFALYERKETEGYPIQPAQQIAEAFPAVSAFLCSLDPSLPPPASVLPPQPSTYNAEQAASRLTQSILTDAQAIMQRAETEGRDPDAELQEMVGRAVLDGVATGATWAQDRMTEDGVNQIRQRPAEHGDEHDSKRPRFDEAGR